MVQFCEKDNETYAVLDIGLSQIIKIDGKRVVGVIGHAIDLMLPRLDKRRYLIKSIIFFFLNC